MNFKSKRKNRYGRIIAKRKIIMVSVIVFLLTFITGAAFAFTPRSTLDIINIISVSPRLSSNTIAFDFMGVFHGSDDANTGLLAHQQSAGAMPNIAGSIGIAQSFSIFSTTEIEWFTIWLWDNPSDRSINLQINEAPHITYFPSEQSYQDNFRFYVHIAGYGIYSLDVQFTQVMSNVILDRAGITQVASESEIGSTWHTIPNFTINPHSVSSQMFMAGASMSAAPGDIQYDDEYYDNEDIEEDIIEDEVSDTDDNNDIETEYNDEYDDEEINYEYEADSSDEDAHYEYEAEENYDETDEDYHEEDENAAN